MGNSIPGLTSQISSPSDIAQATTGTSATSSGGDSDFFKQLDGMMQEAGGMPSDYESQVTALLQGNGQDLHSAMIAVEKADLSFQMMMQVRNKIIQAYQTISQIPF
jgi:flagellar hook-basal body complex protein FliE